MRRSHVFWGAFCIALGVLLIGREQLRTLDNLETIAPSVLGVGFILLGLSFAVRQRLVQTIAALIAGICVGFFTAAALTEQGVLNHHVRIGCNTHDALELEESDSDDDTTDSNNSDADTISKRSGSDTTAKPAKPVY